jgi:hypothetical protein
MGGVVTCVGPFVFGLEDSEMYQFHLLLAIESEQIGARMADSTIR